MKSSEFDYQILNMTPDFFCDYAESNYPEILCKQGRPYNCLLLETKYDYFICIPYRTNIGHQQAFFFRESVRSKKHRSGLDYSKIVIVEKAKYIAAENALIDRDEYLETRKSIARIARQANEYIDTYVKHCRGEKILNQRFFDRRYKYTTLKYFHKELGIEKGNTQSGL